ncbi:MAG: YdcF family protein, partial [Alcaligenaceae bacterium]
MFFIVSKTVGWLLTPTNLIISLTVIGLLLLLTRLAGLGRKVLVIAALLLTFFAFIPVGYWLMVPL